MVSFFPQQPTTTLLLLVLLLFLAYTNVIIAKSALNEIARRQNVSESLGSSPNGLSTVRNLQEDTASGKSNKAQNAEERTFDIKRLAAELKENEAALRSTLTHVKKKHHPLDELFKQLNFNEKDMLIQSSAFEEWYLAVERQREEEPGIHIIWPLLHKIPETELATILYKARDVRIPKDKGTKPFDYLLSYWDIKGNDPYGMYDNYMAITKSERGSLPDIWYEYAIHKGMTEEEAKQKLAVLKDKEYYLFSQ